MLPGRAGAPRRPPRQPPPPPGAPPAGVPRVRRHDRCPWASWCSAQPPPAYRRRLQVLRGGLVLLNTVCREAAACPACGRAGAAIPVRRSLEIRLLSCLREGRFLGPSASESPGPPVLLAGGPEVMHGLRHRSPVLSQSEDQNRTHPALTFVHLMSTQVRASDLKTARSAHCSDPQIATRTRIQSTGRSEDHPGLRIKHSNLRHEHPDPCRTRETLAHPPSFHLR